MLHVTLLGAPRTRKPLVVWALTLALLVLATPVAAQTADPLGLISFGALLPFRGGAGEMSLLEVSAPVADVELHMFLYDHTCTRVSPSIGLSLTANDVSLIRIDGLAQTAGGKKVKKGLIAVASTDASGFILQPLTNPIHARVLWIAAGGDFVRIFEPISIQNPEAKGASRFWNPLRTAAAFWAPLEGAGTHTSLQLICPTQNITSSTAGLNPAFPSPDPFPELLPAPVLSGPTPLRLRVYDDEESLLRDVAITCQCLSNIPVVAIDAIYADPVNAPSGTYTEIEGGVSTTGPPGPFAFTGWRVITTSGLDYFGRLSNANVSGMRGTVTRGAR